MAAGFCHLGFGWNSGESAEEFLGSVGVGLIAKLRDEVRAELYWGLPFIGENEGMGDLQDHGLHFRMTLTTF